MNGKITILNINTKPMCDPYTVGVASRITLKLDPRDRTAWVTQEFNDRSTLADEWHGLVRTWEFDSYPSQMVMRQWIEDEMDDLMTICDGFAEFWDGSNHVGRYTDEARVAAERIEFKLDNGAPADYYEFWPVGSWLENSRNEITADLDDEQLVELADAWEPLDDIVINGNILDFITEIRDTLKLTT